MEGVQGGERMMKEKPKKKKKKSFLEEIASFGLCSEMHNCTGFSTCFPVC